MDITILDIGDSRKTAVEVHAAGCNHSTTKFHLVSEPWSITVDTRIDAFMAFNGDFYQDGGKDACFDIHFKPCVKDLPNGTWPTEFGL